MTKTNETPENGSENTENAGLLKDQTTDVDDGYTEEVDPMIAEMVAAEAELEKAGSGTASDEGTEGEATPAPENGQTAKPEVKADKEKRDTPMIPKARFDEVNSENALLKEQVIYLKGAVDTHKSAAKNTQTNGQTQTGTAEQKADQAPKDSGEASEVDEIDSLIDAAEAKKLTLAEKYDEGELSAKQWKEQETAIDREIRDLSKQRIDRVREESRADTQAVISAERQADLIRGQAIEIQKQHPNIEVIDATPKHIKEGIWAEITVQAAQNLAMRGINVNDGSANAHLALMQEKARLTDSYTPETLKAFLPENFVPKGQAAQSGTGQTGQKQPSETALNRKAKLELADSQPPSIADMGTSGGQQITEADIAKMTDDEIADLMTKAPQLVNRLVGGATVT